MALVKQTNADVYLHEHASIFAYHPPSRMLLWGCYDHEKEHWELHKNGTLIDTGRSPLVDRDDAKLFTHYEMVTWIREYQVNIPINTDEYIHGRISPDKSTIYVHDLKSRSYLNSIQRAFPMHVKNTLHKIAMYMKEQTTEEQTYDKNALSAIR